MNDIILSPGTIVWTVNQVGTFQVGDAVVMTAVGVYGIGQITAISAFSTPPTITVSVTTVVGTQTGPQTDWIFTVYPVSACDTGVNAALSTVTLTPSFVTANGRSITTVLVTLIGDDSVPVSGRQVALQSDRGPLDTISAPSGLSTYEGFVQFTVTSYTAGQAIFIAVEIGSCPVSATTSTVVVSPAQLLANGVSSAVITVTLRDDNSNPIIGQSVAISSSRGAADLITGQNQLSNQQGVATFTVSSIVAGVSVYTATESAGPYDADSSSLVAVPTTVTANGVQMTVVTVTVLDGFGNAVAAQTIALVSSRGGLDKISLASGPSDPQGMVTFNVTSFTAGVSIFTATESVPVDVGTSTVTAFPSDVQANGVQRSNITVTCLDLDSNPVPGKNVVLSSSRGAIDSISPASATSSFQGIALFVVSSYTVGVSDYTAVAV